MNFKPTEEDCVQDPEGTLSLPKSFDFDEKMFERMPMFVYKLSAGICPDCGSTQHQYKKGSRYILICQGCGKQE